MFERYTEKARRVIFFARYEASQYGSPYIETEHLLLGLLRESDSLAKWFPGAPNPKREIRDEIEKRITRGPTIATSVEVPLSMESKKVLTLAAETAAKLGHAHVGTEHLLVGMLRVESSMAAQILAERYVRPGPILEEMAKAPGLRIRAKPSTTALLTLESFLSGLKGRKSDDLVPFFASDAGFIDAFGKRWNRKEIEKEFETLFAPFATKSATYVIEETISETDGIFVATILLKNALLASEQRIWLHRMGVVLIVNGNDWVILLAQVTPVQPA